MEIKSIYIKEVYSKINIIILSKREVSNELKKLDFKISEDDYKNWVLNTCVIGINNIVAFLKEDNNSLISQLKDANDTLYKKVLSVNEHLDPKQIYIDSNRNLTLNFTKTKLTKSKYWSKSSVFKDITLSDFQIFVDIGSSISFMDFQNIILDPKELDVNLNIRVFDESSLKDILSYLDLETESHLKFSILAACLENFTEVINYIKEEIGKTNINLNFIYNKLYTYCIKYNSFLYLNVDDIKYLKKEANANALPMSFFDTRSSDHNDNDPDETVKIKNLKDIQVSKLTDIETKLRDKIYGQDDAILATCNALKRAKMGLRADNKPIATFLFYGPTSTGKTEFAKVLAEGLRGSLSDGLVNIPCGTILNESHTIQSLIGAPPSYVGYDSKSIFNSHFSKNPNLKVILFDEIDKAHPRVFDFLLEAMAEGSVMDSKGKTLNLSDTILIFTCNTGQKEAIKNSKAAGFSLNTSNEKQQHKVEKIYRDAVDNKLAPEFRARLNGQFFFRRLSEEELVQTVKKYLNEFFQTWYSKYKASVSIDESLYEYIVHSCFKINKDCHARDLNKYVNDFIIDKLGDLLLSKNLTPKNLHSLKINLVDEEIIFELDIKQVKVLPIKKSNKK